MENTMSYSCRPTWMSRRIFDDDGLVFSGIVVVEVRSIINRF